MLNEVQKQVFGNLLRAGEHDQLNLLECKRARDGKIVAVICGTYHNGEEYLMFPYAELIDPANGEPTEPYYPPDEDNLEGFVGELLQKDVKKKENVT
jgi:hypothetical protein